MKLLGLGGANYVDSCTDCHKAKLLGKATFNWQQEFALTHANRGDGVRLNKGKDCALWHRAPELWVTNGGRRYPLS